MIKLIKIPPPLIHPSLPRARFAMLPSRLYPLLASFRHVETLDPLSFPAYACCNPEFRVIRTISDLETSNAPYHTGTERVRVLHRTFFSTQTATVHTIVHNRELSGGEKTNKKPAVVRTS